LEPDWDRRRTNLRILIAAAGEKPTPLARSLDVSVNTLQKFLNGSSSRLSESTLEKLLPALGLTVPADLDTDNIIENPRATIRRLVERIPDDRLKDVLTELQAHFPEQSGE